MSVPYAVCSVRQPPALAPSLFFPLPSTAQRCTALAAQLPCSLASVLTALQLFWPSPAVRGRPERLPVDALGFRSGPAMTQMAHTAYAAHRFVRSGETVENPV